MKKGKDYVRFKRFNVNDKKTKGIKCEFCLGI